MDFIIGLGVIAVIVWFFVKISAPKKRQAHKDNFSEGTFTVSGGEVIEMEEFVARDREIASIRERNPLNIHIRPIDPDLLPLPNPVLKAAFPPNKSTLLADITNHKNCHKTEIGYEYIFDLENLSECKKNYDIVKKFKGINFFISSEEADKKEVGQFITCLIKQKEYGCKWCDRFDTYNGLPRSLGCRKIIGYIYGNCKSWDDNEFLTEEEKGVRVDKKKILAQIKEQAKLFRYCPFFNAKKIWENYLRLPAFIDYDCPWWVILKWNDDNRLELVPRAYKESIQETVGWAKNAKILSIKK